MENKQTLQDKLNLLESKLNENIVEIQSVNNRLRIAYDYEDELSKRIVYAKDRTENIRNEYYITTNKITDTFNKMKNLLDVFTGTYYKKL